ncbi:MAG TPA: hypothetical protein VKT28_20305 [Puia sp.]|nr:hypothetical protein [Puia sp.]
MKNRTGIITLFLASFFLSSCEVIGGIFKAGVWTGILIVAAIIGLIIYFVTRSGNKS